MGLDNGIVLKTTKTPSFANLCSQYKEGEYEVCYWRKCWGLRNCILLLFDNVQDNDGIYNISVEQIDDIINIINYFNNKEVWDEEGLSIWTHEEYKDKLISDVKMLECVKDFMLNNPDAIVYFYDSY